MNSMETCAAVLTGENISVVPPWQSVT
uniref:Uncharacterized protein n=1 Tax=Anguilla anguilla TaxID=7936 RepID=A0A0E9U428_ANGAN